MEGDTARAEEREIEIARKIADGNRHGGYLPLTSAAVKHKETGEVTLGGDHMDCRLHAYRIATGDRRKVGRLMRKASAFDKFLEENKFIDGFVNENLEFFDRATATQIVGKTLKLDRDITEMHSNEVLNVGNEPGVHAADFLDV